MDWPWGDVVVDVGRWKDKRGASKGCIDCIATCRVSRVTSECQSRGGDDGGGDEGERMGWKWVKETSSSIRLC